jgi:hypothetical protein
VSLSVASGQTVSAMLSTAPGTAGAGDFTSVDVAVELLPGTTSTVVSIPITGDELDESDESFTAELTLPSHASLADAEGTGTIQDDDTLLVSGIDPSSGPAAGGLAVTISGESFEAGATVEIGGEAATGVSVPNPGEILATTPALSPGTAQDVAVTVAGLAAVTLPSGYFADFLDVDGAHQFHDFVVDVAKAGVTAGCGGGNYCPADAVTRAQMAVFLLKAKHGSGYVPPGCAGIFSDVPCPSQFANWIEQLAAEGVTSGCGTGVYCPADPVTRAQMAVFLLKAVEGSGYTPPAATGVFGDVPQADPFAAWIEELYTRGITGGCSAIPLLYCPASPNNRGQMAVFLVRTFGL